MRTSQLYNEKLCSGCGACSAVCPKGAIAMKMDPLGFLRPEIATDRCVDCKKCVHVCTYRNLPERRFPMAAYAAVNQDQRQLAGSSSGGAFAAIAKGMLAEGGYVCGAEMALEEGAKVRHRMIHDEEELPGLQGSKYVQSNLEPVFQEVRQRLSEGKRVLFSGTPCQVAAVKAFIGKENPNLYTVDVVCHGVPSPGQFSAYVQFLEKRHGSRMTRFCFRDKAYGWGKIGSARFENGKTIELPCEQSAYYSLFMSGDLQRESCLRCPYADGRRCADLTLGDYWGIERFQPELLSENGGPIQENKGVSALLVNTEKGGELLRLGQPALRLYPTEPKNVIAGNSQLRRPADRGRVHGIAARLYRMAGYGGREGLFRIKKGAGKLKRLIRR